MEGEVCGLEGGRGSNHGAVAKGEHAPEAVDGGVCAEIDQPELSVSGMSGFTQFSTDFGKLD